MAASFIGKSISLISHSDVRYRGILAGIDTANSTIQLSNVLSLGTEARRPADQYIPPAPEPYEYIIFRASEVKDLAVDENPAPPPVRRSLHDDPAILGASTRPVAAYQQQPQQQVPPQQVPVQTIYAQQSRGQQQRQQQPQHDAHNEPPRRRPNHQNTSGVQNASASLESVERALGDLRVTGGNNAGGNNRRAAAPVKIPTHDFDFASSNAKFDKSGGRTPQEEGDQQELLEAEKKDVPAAYNPADSFFDSLAPAAPLNTSRGGRGRGGRGNHSHGGQGNNIGRTRREEERERNVATFGEPGGIGLLGAGNYVGGWGGYPRRGRGGGRRGGARGGHATVGA